MQDRPKDAWVSGLAFLDQAADFVAMQFQSFGRLHWLYVRTPVTSGNPVFPAVNNLALPPASVGSERYRRQRLSYTRHNSAYASGLIRAAKSDLRSANALG